MSNYLFNIIAGWNLFVQYRKLRLWEFFVTWVTKRWCYCSRNWAETTHTCRRQISEQIWRCWLEEMTDTTRLCQSKSMCKQWHSNVTATLGRESGLWKREWTMNWWVVAISGKASDLHLKYKLHTLPILPAITSQNFHNCCKF